MVLFYLVSLLYYMLGHCWCSWKRWKKQNNTEHISCLPRPTVSVHGVFESHDSKETTKKQISKSVLFIYCVSLDIF